MPKAEFEQLVNQSKELIVKEKAPTTSAQTVSTPAEISCKSCGSYLGNTADIRRYISSHYLIFDKELYKRVRLIPYGKNHAAMDGE